MDTTTETTVGEGDYENPWTYQGSTFTSADIDDFFGFVYRITNLQNGRKYIGRKYFVQKRKLEVADANGRVKVTGKHTTEVLKNLQRTGNFWGLTVSKEKSSPSTEQKDK